MNTLFQSASILLPDASIMEGCLGVHDNRIAFLGEVPAGFHAERVIDCERNLLMPGLVNAHTHLPMTLFRSMADDLPLKDWLETRIYPLEDKLDGHMAYWGTQLALAEMIRGGITCCNDMYFFSEEICQALALSGMRGLIARALIDYGFEERLAQARALHQNWNGAENGRIRISIAPHAEYTMSNHSMRRCVDMARELDAKIHIHLSETANEHEECKMRHNGQTPLQWLDSMGGLDENTILAHCVFVETEDIAAIARKNASVIHNPQSNLKLGSGIAPIVAMERENINVALGTDGAASNNNLDVMEEMRLAATLHKGIGRDPQAISAAQAIDMATANGAKALGFSAGALEVGRLADIILIGTKAPHMQPRTNLAAHIAYSAQSSDVLLTMCDGRLLYERGEYYTLNYEHIVSEIARISKNLYS